FDRGAHAGQQRVRCGRAIENFRVHRNTRESGSPGGSEWRIPRGCREPSFFEPGRNQVGTTARRSISLSEKAVISRRTSGSLHRSVGSKKRTGHTNTAGNSSVASITERLRGAQRVKNAARRAVLSEVARQRFGQTQRALRDFVQRVVELAA